MQDVIFPHFHILHEVHHWYIIYGDNFNLLCQTTMNSTMTWSRKHSFSKYTLIPTPNNLYPMPLIQQQLTMQQSNIFHHQNIYFPTLYDNDNILLYETTMKSICSTKPHQ